MNWYLAKLVFRILCGDGQHSAQFDEQLRLISANNKEEAFQKAQELGRNGEDMFFNKKEQLVQWQFIDTSELYRLQDLIDGAELYSRIEEKDNAEAHIQQVKARAHHILFSNSHELLNLV